MIRELTDTAFVETKFQNPDICDVWHTKRFHLSRPWWPALKDLPSLVRELRTLLPEHVLLVSFHPLERPIRTARGKKVTP